MQAFTFTQGAVRHCTNSKAFVSDSNSFEMCSSRWTGQRKFFGAGAQQNHRYEHFIDLPAGGEQDFLF